MQLQNKEHFKKLARMHDPHCISIFIPTHRAGMEVNEEVDRSNLKNQIKKVKKELELYQLKGSEIDQLTAPMEELLDDFRFWKHQSDGLAIFRSKDHFEYEPVPVFFDEMVYVADHFYLKPLLPLINEEGSFYLLYLDLKGCKLYEGYSHTIEELDTTEELPKNFLDVVGHDYEQKNLQFRSGQAAESHTMYHGQGEGKDDELEEVLKYLRAVNEGVWKFLHDKKKPLVLAGVEYLVSHFRKINDYNHQFDEAIYGNMEETDPVLLHEKAMLLLEDHFKRQKLQKKEEFELALSRKKASYKEEEIVPAAVNGRIDTLFIQNRETLWGVFDKKNNTIILDEEKKPENSDLLNLAAVETVLNGGAAYLTDQDEMPESTSKLNAILRY